MSDALTREQFMDLLAQRWPESVPGWKAFAAHDAALRARLEEQTARADKAERILSEAGIPQSIQDVRNAWSALTERDEQVSDLTAKLADEKELVAHLRIELAAVTQERNRAQREALERYSHTKQLEQQLAASEQRFHDAENERIEWVKRGERAAGVREVAENWKRIPSRKNWQGFVTRKRQQ